MTLMPVCTISIVVMTIVSFFHVHTDGDDALFRCQCQPWAKKSVYSCITYFVKKNIESSVIFRQFLILQSASGCEPAAGLLLICFRFIINGSRMLLFGRQFWDLFGFQPNALHILQMYWIHIRTSYEKGVSILLLILRAKYLVLYNIEC